MGHHTYSMQGKITAETRTTLKNICRIFSSVYPEQSLVMAHLTFTLCPPIAGLGESRSPDMADFEPVCKTINEKDISFQKLRKYH